MAAATQFADNTIYSSAFDGSAARDLGRVVGGLPLPEEPERVEPSYEERQRAREIARENERARAREEAKAQAFGIPVLGILGVIVAAAMVVTLLMGYIRLAGISGEMSKVRSSIEDLEKQNEVLQIQYESTFDMAEVEAYAINILGMTRDTGETQINNGVKLQDRAQVLAPDETAGIFTRIKSFIASLPEYFS